MLECGQEIRAGCERAIPHQDLAKNMGVYTGRYLWRAGLGLFLFTAVFFGPGLPARAFQPVEQIQVRETAVLSPMWGPFIQQWSDYIGIVARNNGLDPDFIAAVIQETSNGDPAAVSRAGAVGLMGVLPASNEKGRPSPEELKNPALNLRWGVNILAKTVRQSGGDLYSALAAYNGGWAQANDSVSRHYAAKILDSYGRAIMVRNGLSPDMATQWTIAIELTKGNVPLEPLLVLGDQPAAALYTYGEHTIYNYVDETGRAYYVRGYVVPVSLVTPQDALADTAGSGNGSEVDIYLQSRLNQTGVKTTSTNPRLLQACLASLSRLRGLSSTRWFAPSDCPANNR